jgi:hypothetical protein
MGSRTGFDPQGERPSAVRDDEAKERRRKKSLVIPKLPSTNRSNTSWTFESVPKVKRK